MNRPKRPFLHVNEFGANYQPNLWVVPDLIPRDGLVILASAPKTGKTCFATALAVALASGKPFLGHDLEPRPVLWCSHEETIFERLHVQREVPSDVPFFIAYPDGLPALDSINLYAERDRFGRYREEASNDYVFEAAVEANAGLIVIDSLHAAVHRSNLADNAAARRVLGQLRTLIWMHHIPVLILHHVTKSATRGYYPERFADSAQILATASAHFFLESRPHPEGRHLILHGQGRNPAPPSRIDVLSRDVQTYERLDSTPDALPRIRAEDRVRELLEEGWELTAEDIASRLKVNPATVRGALVNLNRESILEAVPGPKRAQRYRIRELLMGENPCGEPIINNL